MAEDTPEDLKVVKVTKIRRSAIFSQESDKMGEAISTNELLKFMQNFKEVIKEKFEKTNEKTEDTKNTIKQHMDKMDTNMEDIRTEMKNMSTKNESLANRLTSIEEDFKRMKYAKMRSPERSSNNSGMQVLPIVNKETRPSKQQDRRDMTEQPTGRMMPNDQPTRNIQDKDQLNRQTDNPMQSSWAEERERELAQAAMQGRMYRDGNRKERCPVNWLSPEKNERQTHRPQKMDCKKWFGDEDTSSDSSEDTSEDEKEIEGEENWKKIERKEPEQEKKEEVEGKEIASDDVTESQRYLGNRTYQTRRSQQNI